MSPSDDRSYYEARLRQEVAAARDARDLTARAVHLDLARHYRDRLDAEPTPAVSSGVDGQASVFTASTNRARLIGLET